ncbi:hypothetical protein, partial [Enterobacter cloacae complex sp. 4DZ3-17B2]|uniref:hypothetical protein n=1 Tax=Enterobacter cloacae complex sp. 4DZ3-17B2 TaxID=2511990 RepID=UPI001CA5A0BF
MFTCVVKMPGGGRSREGKNKTYGKKILKLTGSKLKGKTTILRFAVSLLSLFLLLHMRRYLYLKNPYVNTRQWGERVRGNIRIGEE